MKTAPSTDNPAPIEPPRRLTVPEAGAALRAANVLREWLAKTTEPLAHVSVGDDDVELKVPRRALEVLADALDDLGEGDDVTVAPYDVAVGTTVAAELLNVSTTWVTKLTDSGELDATMHGSKRRCHLGDVVARRRAQSSERRAALDWDFPDPDR